MEPLLSRYIWTHTRPQQMWILFIVALSMIPYFMAFDLPKRIVNGPINGGGFETPDATQRFMTLSFDVPWIGTVTLFEGVDLERMSMLFALSGVFLGLVIVNGLFKFYINTYKGRLGERLLRRIRFELVDRILRFPPETFKRLKGAEVSSMVKDEVEPLGGFTGDAFVAPFLLGGQAATALLFIFLQSFWLGMITAALVAVQFTIIPRMRRRLLVLGRERQLTARQLAGRVSEIVEGIGSVHAYDTSNYERADIASRLGRIFKIRFDIYQWKFLVKFINNFLASVTPFLFYSVGGYLALNGRLDIGQLVAVIGAYKDLPGPLKDLIDWDQNRQDVQVKYTQVVNQFAIDGLLDPALQTVTPQHEPAVLANGLAAVNLGLADDSGAVLVERLNLKINPGEKLAVVGEAGSGAEALADAIARLVWPKTGKIAAGETDILA
ncbi:MAG: ABC transporter transmembrane domain-containing protein, partial [Paracoccaceae bacterium]